MGRTLQVLRRIKVDLCRVACFSCRLLRQEDREEWDDDEQQPAKTGGCIEYWRALWRASPGHHM